MRRHLTWMLSLLLVHGCAAIPPAQVLRAGIVDGAVHADRTVLLQGRMLLPGFGTKALGSDMMATAMVSLLDKDGKPVASGLTDAAGAFTLYRPTIAFAPTPGEFYRLEIIKRFDRSGTGVLLSLQTMVKRLEKSWASISGDAIVVNLLTTAICLYAQDDGLTDFDPVMGLVPGPDFATAGGFGAHTADSIWGRAANLTQMLQTYQDPVSGRDGQMVTRVHAGDVVIDDGESLAAARQYDKIEGSLTIASTAPADIELPDLLWVTQGVTVAPAANRTRLALPGLRRVDGAMAVADQPALTTLSAGRLSVVGSTLRLASLPALPTIGMAGLARVGGDCELSGLKDGLDLTLESLTSVGGRLDIGQMSLSALKLPSLVQVAALRLQGVQGVAGAALDVDTPRLDRAGTVDVQGNTLGLIDLSGLRQTTGSVTLTANGPNAKPHLGALARVGTNLTFSTAASNIVFTNLEAVGSDVTVTACPALTSLDLPKLTGLSGSLTVQQNPQLGQLKLFGLTQVGRDLAVELGVAGEIDVMSLTGVGGHLSVQGPVSTLKLMALATVGGHARITGTGLPNLLAAGWRSVGQTLTIEGNPAMTAILCPSLRTVSGNLVIRNNQNLPICQATSVRKNLTGFTGTVDVTGNQGADCPY
jgi:hypothetical protein